MKKLLLLTLVTIAALNARTVIITNNTGMPLTAEATFFHCRPNVYKRVIMDGPEEIKVDDSCCLRNVKLSSEKAGLTKKEIFVYGKTEGRGSMQSCYDNTFLIEIKNNELIGTRK